VHSGSLSTMGMAFLRVPLGMTTGRREPRGSGGSKNIVKETIYQPRPLLSQIHTTIYIPFTRKARLFENNSEPVGGGGAPLYPPLPGSNQIHVGLYDDGATAVCGRLIPGSDVTQ